MSEAQRENQREYLCCCILIPKGQSEIPCSQPTGGPDNPFCPDCAGRHEPNTNPFVTVTQRLRSNR